MDFIFNSLAPLVSIVLIGMFLRYRSIADESWVDTLNTFALYALFPALILKGISTINLDNTQNFSYIFINLTLLTSVVLILFIGSKTFDFSRELTNTYVTAIFFANVGYLGFPIITSVISNSEATVSVHIAIYTFLLFSLVISILEYSKHGKIDVNTFTSGFKNPLMLSVIIAILLVYFKIKLPLPIDKAITILANGATPTVLVALGIFIMKKLPKVNLKDLAFIVIFKLILIPSIFLVIFYIYKSKELAISTLEAAMPVAITPFALSKIYPMKRELIAVSIVVSSILSIITLSIFIFLLEKNI